MSTALSIKGKTQANDAVTSTINYVNPNATNAQLVSLATAMNNLTTNTVADITRIDKNSLTNTVEKLPRNMALDQATVAGGDISTNPTSPTELTITGNALSSADLRVSKPTENAGFVFVDWSLMAGSITVAIVKESGTPLSASEIVFELPETDTYQAASVTLTITAEG